MKTRLFIILLILFPVFLSAQSQETSRLGLSVHRGLFPSFSLDESEFSGSSVFDLRAHFYDVSHSRLEYTLNYKRGYHPSVSYSYGLSAGYRIKLGDRGVLKPAFGIENYKLRDRECRSAVKTILNALFDVDDSCSDDVHASFNPSVALEMNISGPVWIVLDVTYRAMLSSTSYVKETITETAPDGSERENKIRGTEHSFYGAGFGAGTGIRINF